MYNINIYFQEARQTPRYIKYKESDMKAHDFQTTETKGSRVMWSDSYYLEVRFAGVVMSKGSMF